MARTRVVLVALMGLVPAAAFTHGSEANAADPPLHVNPTLEDCSVQFAPELTQSAYHRFVREFGSVSAFKMNSAPTNLGARRVAFGVEQIRFTVEEKADAWNDTFYHPDADHELGAKKDFPKLRLQVGVTDRMDVGAFYTRNPNANYGWLGVDLKYGLLQQSPTTPVSLALRGAYTKTLYVTDMDMHALTADVAAGRTFWNRFTPYLGVGSDAILARETSDAVALQTEEQVVPHAMGGFTLHYWHLALGAELNISALNSYQIQLTSWF